jgi:hypothetical protein
VTGFAGASIASDGLALLVAGQEIIQIGMNICSPCIAIIALLQRDGRIVLETCDLCSAASALR